ncbi:MAG: hypothetical protein JWL76_1983 [Thermoleophilia bacterium]|nr:hypothetical protein [Thermoleophilia bacterium]
MNNESCPNALTAPSFGPYADAKGRLHPGNLLHDIIESLMPGPLLDVAIRTAILTAFDDPARDQSGVRTGFLRTIVEPRDCDLLTGDESDVETAYLSYFCPWDLRQGVEVLAAAREVFENHIGIEKFAEQVATLTVTLAAVTEQEA